MQQEVFKGYDYPTQSVIMGQQYTNQTLGFQGYQPNEFPSTYEKVNNPMKESSLNHSRSQINQNQKSPNLFYQTSPQLNAQNNFGDLKLVSGHSQESHYEQRNKYPNLLQNNQSQSQIQDYTKVNPFNHQEKQKPDHYCPYTHGVAHQEEYYQQSYLFMFELFLEFCLVFMYLIIFLPCYMITFLKQIKKIPMQKKKICGYCDKYVDSELNKEQQPQPVPLFLKVIGVLIFFLLWKLMGYPFFMIYYNFLKYIMTQLANFFDQFI